MTREIIERIRNPLNALQLNLDNLDQEIARLSTENKEDIGERLTRMRKSLAELDSFLCEVLRFADVPKPQITPVNMNALVREVVVFATPESRKKELAVKVDLQENLPEIQGDPVQMKQAILNLLLNAIEACPGEGSVTVTTEAEGNEITLKISDNGGGIPESHRERIFEPFFSTKESRAGLGLALALEIVKMHQGRLSFTSEVGKESSFQIFVPIKGHSSKK